MWKGPLPDSLTRFPQLIRDIAVAAGCDVVVIDSLKDTGVRLTEDEGGTAVNMAIQFCIAADIDVVALHHERKTGASRRGPRRSMTSTAPSSSRPEPGR